MDKKIHLAIKKVNDIMEKNPKTLSTEQFKTVKENIEMVINYVNDEIEELPNEKIEAPENKKSVE